MVGPEVGAKFEFYVQNRWWVNVEMKMALMSNRAEQSTEYFTVNNTGTHDYVGNRTEDHTAFAGDLALTFVYRWSPNFSTQLGYQAIWLERIALATDNLNTDINILTQGPAQLNHAGRTVFHGPQAGITIGW
jgi:hypothetical protein